MILLLGSEGSMGKRYQAIFNYLKLEYLPIDEKINSFNEMIDAFQKCDRVLIATPTNSHISIIKMLLVHDNIRDILCEKPIAKSSKQVAEILNLFRFRSCKFNMVFQYGEILANNGNPNQFTSYDYFRTGNDGLYWDCLQIIALASGPIKLNNKSPYWKCEINDQDLDIASMDHAYLKFIKRWVIGNIEQDHKWLLDIHKKVEDYASKL